MRYIASRGVLVLLFLAALTAWPLAAQDTGGNEREDIGAAWTPAPPRMLTQEEFPLPRHDPRPLMKALIERKQPTDATPFTFAAVSDMHSRREAAIFDLVRDIDPDFVLTIGDMINVGWGERALSHYRRLEEFGGDLFRQYPIWSVPGNHETGADKDITDEEEAAARRRFSAYFAQPHDEIFSFSYANARFIGLPFEFFEQRAVEGDKLLETLGEELSSAKGKHIFVFSHYSYFTGRWRPQNEVREAAAELFEKHNVVAVLGAHAHVYYRQRRNGVHYIVNATAGGMSGGIPHERGHATLRNALPDDVWFGRKEDGNHQFIRPVGEAPVPFQGNRQFATVITVDGPRVTFHLVNTDGKVWDRAILAGPAGEDNDPSPSAMRAREMLASIPPGIAARGMRQTFARERDNSPVPGGLKTSFFMLNQWR